MRSGQRGGQREEHPATSFLKKQYDFSPQFGPVESSYLLFVLSCVVYGVKIFRYICITISVNELIKAGGL